MYFSEFESYQTSLKDASGVVVEVKLITGETHSSSTIPIEAIAGLIADMEDFYGSKTVLMLWNKDAQALISVAYDKVESVRLLLIKKRS